MSDDQWQLLIFGIYIAGFLAAWPYIAYKMIKNDDYGPDTEDMILHVAMGFLAALVWPGLIPGYFVWMQVKGMLARDEEK
jgi:hypothetical protein